MHVKKLTLKHKAYPTLLAEIASPPSPLYVLGALPADRPTVAIVGSRKTSAYGRGVTQRLAGELAAAGIAIISGLATGIDTLAHQAALAAGGITIGVQGCGLDQIYPPLNKRLAKTILDKGGGLVSE